jgi:mannonate dehydratase
MKLGFGLYRSLLTSENFQFARQLGATHVVAHLVDYFPGSSPQISSGDEMGLGVSSNADRLWTYEELRALRLAIKDGGLELAAIENFDPSHWSDVLLDGPRKAQQLENLKRTIQAAGRAGIPVIGYNFTLAGLWGWRRGKNARGDAHSVSFDASDTPEPLHRPIPTGMVWNMVFDPDAPPGFYPPVPEVEIWERARVFLEAVLPVADDAGVRLAAHPDDPPVEQLRGAARFINHVDRYDRLLSIYDGPSNALEFCMGSVQEMVDSNVYEALDRFSAAGRIAYVHCRNVVGRVPSYREVFIDEGDIDIPRALSILAANGFDGVVIPDHTPETACAAPWHAGMAYAMGYLRAVLDQVSGTGARGGRP